MAANKNWARWIFASFSKYFDDHKDGVEMRVEGDESKTADLADYFEFRMNGPFVKESSKDWWELQVMINILVVHKMGDNIHTLHSNVGKMVAAFTNAVPMLRYGSGIDDDNQVFGCMQLITDKDNAIDVHHLGQVNPDIREMQSMVGAIYCMYLEV